MSEIKVESTDQLLACRICLATDTELFGIHEEGLDEAFVEVTGTPFGVWDGLPQHLCGYCRALLLKSSGLRERSQRAQEILKQSLIYQHYLTTDLIRTIDRISNRLSFRLSTEQLDEPINQHDNHREDDLNDNIHDTDSVHDDDNQDDDTLPVAEIENDPIENNDVNDNDDSAVENNDELATDNDVQVKDEELHPVVVAERIELEIELPKKVLRKRKVVKNVKTVRKVKKDVKNVKVPKVVKKIKAEEKKDKTDEATKYKRKKKGFKRFFSCEEDYIKFENNYNISIEKISEEEQRKDMEARKLSANYARAHLRCEKCFKGFLSEATFENHQKVHDPIMGANECHLCFARFKHPTRLRRHMETHTLKFTCKLCPLVTRHRGMAMMHSDFHSGKTFECKYCGLTFKKKTTFNTHIRVQHPLENASGGACDVCGETFIGKRGLQQHKTMAHKKETVECKQHAHTRSAPAVKRFGEACDVCGETFIKKRELQQHKTMAHKKLPIPELKCSQCNVQFESLDAVVRHADCGCDPQLRPCPQCGDGFQNSEQLETHVLNAHAKQFYNCDDCDKSFATKSSLGTHVDRVHLKIKPKKTGFYKYNMYPKKMQVKRVEEICEICGKGYPSSTWLKYHQRTHTGERPYKCPECPKSYMTPAALQSHSVSHTGERRWQCSQCPKTFLHQSSIYKHKLVHTGEKPFSCHICSKTFTQSGSLATHVKYVHLKIKPPPRRRNRNHQPV